MSTSENVEILEETGNSNNEKENGRVVDIWEKEKYENRIRELEQQLKKSISEKASFHQNDLATEVQILRRQLKTAHSESDKQLKIIEDLRKTNEEMESEIYNLERDLDQSRSNCRRNWEDLEKLRYNSRRNWENLEKLRYNSRRNWENLEKAEIEISYLQRKLNERNKKADSLQQQVDNAEELMTRRAEILNKYKENLKQANEEVRRLQFELNNLKKENEQLIENNDDLISFNSERNAVIHSLQSKLSACGSWLKIGLGKVEEFKPLGSTDESSSETSKSPEIVDSSSSDFIEIQKCQKVEKIMQEYKKILSVDVEKVLESYDSTEKLDLKQKYEDYIRDIEHEYKKIQQKPDIRFEDLTGIPIFLSPLSPNFLESYCKYKKENSTVDPVDMECLICKCDVQQEQESSTCSNCSRTYHENCLTKWISTNSTCPVCRFSIPVSNEESSSD